MAGRVEGKVAFITGAARGQGRSHAVRLAEEGADIIAVDLCGPVDTINLYPPATDEDLAETVRQVEALGRRIVATKADVRNVAALSAAVEEGAGQLGGLDIVVANAAIFEIAAATDVTEACWSDVIDVNLTGVWNTCKVSMSRLIANDHGGSLVLISSAAGLKGVTNTVHYAAAKHGVVGIMRSLANELGPHMVRVNSVHPTSVDTHMIQNERTWRLFLPDNPHPTREDVAPAFCTTNILPIPWVESVDVSNAVLFLASDESRYITGVTLPVDAGHLAK
ncbi:MAG TPA: mycofactocin-coupled SDR family oxidoreductase [Acidimicrobiales bacterium]|jgi:SDR family mycofactocin-dependent oxidoreductase|nr:mycofactocin-coupled SDR family oxidoreductase [Acidimicrobiales bacterium]